MAKWHPTDKRYLLLKCIKMVSRTRALSKYQKYFVVFHPIFLSILNCAHELSARMLSSLICFTTEKPAKWIGAGGALFEKECVADELPPWRQATCVVKREISKWRQCVNYCLLFTHKNDFDYLFCFICFLQIGTILGNFFSGLLLHYYSWHSVFYFFGGVSLIWFIFFVSDSSARDRGVVG